MMHVATLTVAADGGWYVLAPALDRVHAIGPMETADLALAGGDRVLIAPRADVAGTWVIVAKMPPA